MDVYILNDRKIGNAVKNSDSKPSCPPGRIQGWDICIPTTKVFHKNICVSCILCVYTLATAYYDFPSYFLVPAGVSLEPIKEPLGGQYPGTQIPTTGM
jgi:hypothetical protein